MSAKSDDTKSTVDTQAEKPEEVVSNQIIAELDRVHVRTPRY
jgi:hypothetical protein